MPINAYTGLMGSGKSFEVVSSVIVPAILQGRRAVTNIDGIDSDAIRAYLHEKQNIPFDKLGHVIHCRNEDINRSDFFPFGDDRIDTFCKGGDLIAIDEAWRFFGTDCKILNEHKIFFREHRHYCHPDTKVSCDLVLMVQDIGDLKRELKVVVELNFRTTKIKSLGLNKTYRIEMWEGFKQNPRQRVAVTVKNYDPEIFPLYKSYSGGDGKELTVDERQNILKNPKIWAMVLMTFVFLFGGGYFTVRFFTQNSAVSKSSVNNSSNSDSSISSVSSTSQQAHRSQNQVLFSPEWRIVGSIFDGKNKFIVLQNNDGFLRYESPSLFSGFGRQLVGKIDGYTVTFFSGSVAKK